MKAEIITSGTELLLGELTDTHTSFIASQLALMGIDLYFVSIVGDTTIAFYLFSNKPGTVPIWLLLLED